MSSARKIFHWSNALRLLIGACVILYVFSRFIPSSAMSDYPMVDGLDDSWTLALHLAFVHHWQFGTDIVFTYGPWGFLARGYYPETYLISVASWAVLAIIFLCASWRLASFFFKNHWLAALWMIAFTAVVSIPVGEDFNTKLVAWGVLLLFLQFFVEERALAPVSVLLVISLAWLSLVKFTGFIESIIVVGILAIDAIFRHRRFPWVIPLWLGGFLFFWIAAGQQIDGLFPYLINSWQITNGYTEAMMLGNYNGTMNAVYFSLIALFICVLEGWLAWIRQRRWGTLGVVGLAGILFLVLKFNYIRNSEQNEAVTALTMIMVVLVCFAAAWWEGKITVVITGFVLLLSLSFAGFIFHRWLPENDLAKQVADTFSIYNLTAPVAASTTGYLQKDYYATLARERKESALPVIKGDTDLYSYDQNVLFAHGIAYQPRPVLQSYSAYTPELAELNANHLRSDLATRNILFAIQTIDNRYPSLDDGLSWPELLTLYKIQGVSDGRGTYLLLTRTLSPGNYCLTPITNTFVNFGEPISLPTSTNGPVWVEINFKKTFKGNLISTIYKPPMLTLNVTLHDQKTHHYRLVPGMAQAGFLLSPLVADNRSFAMLATPDWEKELAGKEVKSMTISADTKSGSTDCYESPIEVQFYCFHFTKQNLKLNWPAPPADN